MDEEVGKILGEHSTILTRHDQAISQLTISTDACAHERRRHEDRLNAQQAALEASERTQQMLIDTMNETRAQHKIEIAELRDANKKLCEQTAEQTKYTKIISDVFTTGVTIKKILVGGAAVVVSLGTILGGIVFGVSWLLTVPIPS